MAKKQLEEDLLTGGSVKSDKDKAAKKAEKDAQRADKIRKKNEAQRAAIKSEIDKLKASKAEETDAKKLEAIDKKIKKLSDKYASVGKGVSLEVAPKTKKIIQSVVCIIIVVALLVTYVATGAVRKGFVSSLGIPAQYFTGLTVTNGEQKAKIKVSTYNYYFAVTYNSLMSTQEQYEQYGIDLDDINLNVDFDKKLSKQTYEDEDGNKMTWAEHIHNEVIDSIENTYTYYLEAVKANDGKEPEITEEQQQEIDDTLDEYRETAHSYGYTLSAYLVQAMGKGVTESVFRTETTRQYIADNYQTELSETLSEKEYSEDDYNKYKQEHSDELTSVDIKVFECTNEDDAKAFKNALEKDGSNFADLCVKYSSSDFDKASFDYDGFSTIYGATKEILQYKGLAIATAEDQDDEDETSDEEELVYPGLDWLFSSDRKAGDIKQYSTSVVYVISPASISDMQTVNVRHILIQPELDSDDESATVEDNATEEQWAAAYKEAEKLLNEWKSGDKTEDSFADLVADNTADTGSAETGGLYENVIPGDMVDSFSYWCFEDGRKAGDTAIVKSEYGYHIMYFVGKTGTPVWQYTAQQALASDDSTDEIEKLEESYEAKINWLGSRYFEKDVDIDT
ncbi:MAG: peptidylprolyl isomerase [Eubacterium sp.]